MVWFYILIIDILLKYFLKCLKVFNVYLIFKLVLNKCNDFMFIGLFGNIGFDSCDWFIEDCNKYI